MKIFRHIFILLFLKGCAPMNTPKPTLNPGPEYWVSVGEQMAAKFPGAKPAPEDSSKYLAMLQSAA